MNHQDKQLTSFLGMTIGSALDDYMSNLANKYQESEQKTAAIEENLWLVKQEKNKEKTNIISYKKLKYAPTKRTVNENSFTLSIDTKDKRTLDPNASIKDRK